jgi:hypothetical protein
LFNCFNSAIDFDVIDGFNIFVKGFAIDFGDTNNAFANVLESGFNINFVDTNTAFTNI